MAEDVEKLVIETKAYVSCLSWFPIIEYHFKALKTRLALNAFTYSLIALVPLLPVVQFLNDFIYFR
jgi:hypothetical protein